MKILRGPFFRSTLKIKSTFAPDFGFPRSKTRKLKGNFGAKPRLYP